MSPSKHYSNAPLTEAVIDVRVEFPSTISLDTLKKIHSELEKEYPEIRENIIFKGQLSSGANLMASAEQSISGYSLVNNDKRQICQIGLEGFSFSRLKPYENWKVFRNEARCLWNAYRKVTQPSKIKRVAVRYINQLDIPLPASKLIKYFKLFPQTSPIIRKDLEGFFMQLRIPQNIFHGTLLLTEALMPSQNPKMGSVLLDIDMFVDKDVPNDEEGIWRYFEQLHDRKNEIFEACITPETRRIIK